MSESNQKERTQGISISTTIRHKNSIGSVTIDFPTTTEKFQEILRSIDVENGKIRVNHYETSISKLQNYLPKQITLDEISELNYIALRLKDMSETELEIFGAVIESGKHCNSLQEIINIDKNLEIFDLQPAYTEKQYGDFLIESKMDEFHELYSRFENSTDPLERLFLSHSIHFDAKIDAVDYARYVIEKENGVFSEYGYLTQNDNFRNIYRGAHDLPEEYRLGNHKPEVLRLENVEIVNFLLKAYALSGTYTSFDVFQNLHTLANLKNTEYLILMDERSLILVEAVNVYRFGTAEYDLFTQAEKKADAKIFAIHLTNNLDDSIRGDVVTRNVTDHCKDILNYSIKPIYVDIIPKFGPLQTYNYHEWEKISTFNQENIRSITRHFDSNDIQDVHQHLKDLLEKDISVSTTVDERTFLYQLNEKYKEKASSSKPDMFRITNHVAKKMLINGDTAVYRPTADILEKLRPIDAVKSTGDITSSRDQEFLIKADDVQGFNTWVSREIKSFKRQQEKSQLRDPEL